MFYKIFAPFPFTKGDAVLFLSLKEKVPKRSKQALRLTRLRHQWSRTIFPIPEFQVPGSSDYTYTQNQKARIDRFSDPAATI